MKFILLLVLLSISWILLHYSEVFSMVLVIWCDMMKHLKEITQKKLKLITKVIGLFSLKSWAWTSHRKWCMWEFAGSILYFLDLFLFAYFWYILHFCIMANSPHFLNLFLLQHSKCIYYLTQTGMKMCIFVFSRDLYNCERSYASHCGASERNTMTESGKIMRILGANFSTRDKHFQAYVLYHSPFNI